MQILAISGSLQRESYNTRLLRAASELAPPGIEVELYDGLASLPPYDADLDVEPAPAPVRDLRERIAAADALLISTPEYNGSIPGQLKNAVDWASRPFPASSLRNKPIALAGATPGAYGAMWAQTDLRRVLGITGARVVGEELPVGQVATRFDDEGRLIDPEVRAHLVEHLELLAVEVRLTAAVTA
ncbi:MAG: NADPH-dependent FMN reductase [Gaiellaceae bacterium]